MSLHNVLGEPCSENIRVRSKPFKKTAKSRIRLLFVDDCKISLNAWKTYLAKHSAFSVACLAPTQLHNLGQAAAASPDVVVVTIPLLNANGVSLMRLIFKAVPTARVIGFGGDGDCDHTKAFLRAGAKGFLERNCAPAELVRAIERVARGEMFLSSEIQQMIIHTRENTERGSADSPHPRLNERDCEIVGGIANGFANKELATRLGISVRTVEKRRLQIMQNLGLAGVAQLTKYAIRQGITSLD